MTEAHSSLALNSRRFSSLMHRIFNPALTERNLNNAKTPGGRAATHDFQQEATEETEAAERDLTDLLPRRPERGGPAINISSRRTRRAQREHFSFYFSPKAAPASVPTIELVYSEGFWHLAVMARQVRRES
jgi:hypothetical protein